MIRLDITCTKLIWREVWLTISLKSTSKLSQIFSKSSKMIKLTLRLTFTLERFCLEILPQHRGQILLNARKYRMMRFYISNRLWSITLMRFTQEMHYLRSLSWGYKTKTFTRLILISRELLTVTLTPKDFSSIKILLRESYTW